MRALNGWMIGTLLLSTGVALADGKAQLKPGNWEVTVTREMVGMPYAPPPTTINKCVTPQDANDPVKVSASKDCDNKDYKIDGNKVTFSVECHMHGGVQKGSGQMTYAQDSYEGTINIDVQDPRGGKMKMTEHLKGRRTGDCAAK